LISSVAQKGLGFCKMLFAVRTKMTYMGNIMEKNIVSIWSGKNKNEKNIK